MVRNQELIAAAANGKTNQVKYLIKGGADVNAKNKDGYTPLHGAARNGHLETVKYLTDKVTDTLVFIDAHLKEVVLKDYENHPEIHSKLSETIREKEQLIPTRLDKRLRDKLTDSATYTLFGNAEITRALIAEDRILRFLSPTDKVRFLMAFKKPAPQPSLSS